MHQQGTMNSNITDLFTYTLRLFLCILGTPDPYVVLRVQTSPNSKQRTTTKDDKVNPIWNEDFKFYLNPKKSNTLGI
jgi:Ca2+-dependent lipid-binding protein